MYFYFPSSVQEPSIGLSKHWLVNGIPMETSDQQAASSMSPKPGPGTSPTIRVAGGMF